MPTLAVVLDTNAYIALLDRIILGIFTHGTDMSQPARANSLWDYEICFSVGRTTRFAGTLSRLITTDSAILDAATAASLQRVHPLDEYEALVSLPYDDFREWLAQSEPSNIACTRRRAGVIGQRAVGDA